MPYTGREYLDSLDDGREIWIYGERVNKITEHPAFQNCARMIARLDPFDLSRLPFAQAVCLAIVLAWVLF